MRKIWLAVLIVVAIAAAGYTVRNSAIGIATSEAEAAVEWAPGSFAEIMAQAKAADKPVMIDFYATWCGPCKRLTRETYSDAAVVTFTDENLICAKIDVDEEENKTLTEHYMIYNYPTILFVKPDGSEIDRRVGFLPPDEYLQLMKDYLAGVNTYDDYLRRVEAAPDDLELNFTVGEKLTHRLERDAAHRHLERAIELDPQNEQGKAVDALFALADLHRKLAIRNADETEWPHAVGYVRQAIESFPSKETNEHGLRRIAYFHKKAGSLEAAADVYLEIIVLKPEDPGALNAFAWFCAEKGIALEEATEKAKLAVELSEGAAGYLDTLAEVYHASGMHEEAIATIQEAIAKDPEDKYLKDQLEKFEAAMKGHAEA